MPTRQLYNVRIPQDAQTNTGHQGLGRQIESLTSQASDPVIEALGVQSGDHTIQASYAHKYADKIAAELEGLMQASGFEYLPYYTPSDPGRSGDEYIVIEDGSVEAASVHEEQVQVVSGTFTPNGTRESKRRSLEVTPLSIPEAGGRNDFGNTEAALVAIPSSTSERTWYDRETKTRADVVVEQSVEGELASVDLIDARGVSELTAPFELVYNPPYAGGYRTGVVLWDTRGFDVRDDADGDTQWRKCYRASHEFSGVPVVDTGRLRLRLDTQDGITAEEYDPQDEDWTTTGLPTSDWSLTGWDVVEIAPNRIHVQVEFQNTSLDEVRALNLHARRGRQVVHWLVPQSVSEPTPGGLVDYLSPVADESLLRPQSSLGLISVEEIRR